MTKELKALEYFRTEIVDNYYAVECFEIIENALKVLEIIKEKEVDVMTFRICLRNNFTYEMFETECLDNCDYEEYPPYNHSMTKEEFELVKEFLQ